MLSHCGSSPILRRPILCRSVLRSILRLYLLVQSRDARKRPAIGGLSLQLLLQHGEHALSAKRLVIVGAGAGAGVRLDDRLERVRGGGDDVGLVEKVQGTLLQAGAGGGEQVGDGEQDNLDEFEPDGLLESALRQNS